MIFHIDFNLVFHDNLTQKFIQGKNLDPKIITSCKIGPKIYFLAEKVPSKNGTSRIPIYGSSTPPTPPPAPQRKN